MGNGERADMRGKGGGGRKGRRRWRGVERSLLKGCERRVLGRGGGERRAWGRGGLKI